MRVPAVVGSFPEPFLHGSEGKRFPVRLDCAPDAARPVRRDVRRPARPAPGCEPSDRRTRRRRPARTRCGSCRRMEGRAPRRRRRSRSRRDPARAECSRAPAQRATAIASTCWTRRAARRARARRRARASWPPRASRSSSRRGSCPGTDAAGLDRAVRLLDRAVLRDRSRWRPTAARADPAPAGAGAADEPFVPAYRHDRVAAARRARRRGGRVHAASPAWRRSSRRQSADARGGARVRGVRGLARRGGARAAQRRAPGGAAGAAGRARSTRWSRARG